MSENENPQPTGDPADASSTPDTATAPAPFDPAEHTVDEVKAHFDGADDAERARVLDAERTGKARAGVLKLAEQPDGRPVQAEKIAPRRYRAGEYAEQPVYGLIADDGSVSLTENAGASEPKPGERGTILVQRGDAVGREVAALLEPTED